MTFREHVKKAIELGYILELSEEFEVARSTVIRWSNGTAVPAPAMQDEIIRFIEDSLGV